MLLRLEGRDAAVVEADSAVDIGGAKLEARTDDGAGDSGVDKLVEGVVDSVAQDGSGTAELDNKASDGAAKLG